MQNIKSTIEEYKESRELLKQRICELSAKIAESNGEKGKEDSLTKQFHERRMKLYTELWDIEYAIREMQDYLELTETRAGRGFPARGGSLILPAGQPKPAAAMSTVEPHGTAS